MSGTVSRLTPSSRLRRKQAADRMRAAAVLAAQAAHPARLSAVVSGARRQRIERHYAAAARHLKAAEVLLREAA